MLTEMRVKLLSSSLHFFAVHAGLAGIQELHEVGDELLPVELRTGLYESPAVLGFVVFEGNESGRSPPSLRKGLRCSTAHACS